MDGAAATRPGERPALTLDIISQTILWATRQQAIIQLPAGTWAAVTQGNGPPVQFTATSGTPGATSEPAAAVTITEIDFGFAGFDHVPAGPQIWKIVHKGTQPHMLVLPSVPAKTTLDQAMALINAPQNATPAPAGSIRTV